MMAQNIPPSGWNEYPIAWTKCIHILSLTAFCFGCIDNIYILILTTFCCWWLNKKPELVQMWTADRLYNSKDHSVDQCECLTRPKWFHSTKLWTPVASFTKEVNQWSAKRPLVFNGRLANHQLTSLVKEATVLSNTTVIWFKLIQISRV